LAFDLVNKIRFPSGDIWGLFTLTGLNISLIVNGLLELAESIKTEKVKVKIRIRKVFVFNS